MKVILAVGGGIAAYKSAELARLLMQQNHQVQVVMTSAAEEFVRPLTFAALTGQKVLTNLFAIENAIEHIAVAQEHEFLVIAPTTADLMAKLAHGLADDFLTTLYLAFTGPVLIAPAMNVNMWQHPATQANLATLVKRGHTIVEPGSGYLACGMTGPGRLADPEAIAAAIERTASRRLDLEGETVLITAGPTQEPLDPVRYISNRSSGKMGYALADAAQSRGAKVILISGPSALHPPARCEVVRVTTAAEMRKAVLELMVEATMIIKAAAVADYRPVNVSEQKLKRSGPLTLELAPTEDILAEVTKQRRPGQLIVGFAAETQNTMENGRAKLLRKGADAIVVNDVSGEGVGIDSDRNAATFLTSSKSIELPEMTKRKLADRILDEISALRRPRPVVFEVDEDSPQDKVLKESVAPITARRQIIVE